MVDSPSATALMLTSDLPTSDETLSYRATFPITHQTSPYQVQQMQCISIASSLGVKGEERSPARSAEEAHVVPAQRDPSITSNLVSPSLSKPFRDIVYIAERLG